MEIELQNMSGPERYRLLISAVVPRPIAFVTSLNTQGQTNLAPFSYFNVVTARPPMISISIGQRQWQGQRVKKDTLQNIEATREFVVNIASVRLMDQVNEASAELPPGVSELERVKLTPVPSKVIQPPRVAECAVHLECKLDRVIMLGDEPQVGLVIAQVVHCHADDAVWDAEQRTIDPKRLDPLSRLGGIRFGSLGDIYSRPRPT